MRNQGGGARIWGLMLLFLPIPLPQGFAEPDRGMNSADGWPSRVVSQSPDSVNPWDNPGTALSDPNILILDEDATRAAATRSVSHRRTASTRNRGRPLSRTFRRRQEALRHTSISIGLLFFAAVLALVAMRLPPPKAEEEPPTIEPLPEIKVEEEEPPESPSPEPEPEPEIEEGKPEVKARERIEKVRDLLPAAENLTKALGTQEAQTLLFTVRKSVDEAMKDEDSKKITDFLETAIAALHRLHEAAGEEAEALVQEHEPIVPLSLLGPWEQLTAATISGIEIDTDTVKPFMTTIKSIQENITKLTLRMQSARDHLSKGKAFQDEDDGKVLVAATLDLECIRATIETKRRATQNASELHKKALSSIRALLLGERYHLRRYAQGQVELLQVYVELARHTRHEEDARSNAAALEALEAGLEEAKEMITQQKTELENLTQSQSLDTMIDASNAAGDLETALRELLERCWDAATSLRRLPERVDERSRSLLKEAAEKTQSRAINDETALKDTMESLYSPLAMVLLDLSDASATTKHLVNPSLVRRLTRSTNNKAVQADKLIKDMAKIAQTVHHTSRLETARTQMEKLIANAVTIARLREQSYLEIMGCHLMSFLEKDMKTTAIRVARPLSYAFNPSGEQASMMPWLKGQYEAARDAAKNAKTVEETAKAAASVRTLAEVMMNAMYTDQQEQNEG